MSTDLHHPYWTTSDAIWEYWRLSELTGHELEEELCLKNPECFEKARRMREAWHEIPQLQR